MRSEMEIETRQEFFTIDDLIKLKNERMVVPNRRFSNKQAAIFIDSVLRKGLITHFFMDGAQRQWVMYDGVKRFNAIVDFIDNKFPTVYTLNTFYNVIPSGTYYKDINLCCQARIQWARVPGYVINPGINKEDKEELIKRITTRSISCHDLLLILKQFLFR